MMARWLVVAAISCGGPRPAPPDNHPVRDAGIQWVEPNGPRQPSQPDPAATGFDLYVDPPDDVKWMLDGERLSAKLPSRVRGIAPGPHVIAIQPPAPYQPVVKTIDVEAGKAFRVDIHLAQ